MGNTWWIFGCSTLIVASVINLLTYPYLDMVILSVLASLILIFNAVFSIALLDETFTMRYDLVSILLIAAGVIGCCILANSEPVEY